MESRGKILDKAKKLQELSNRGIDGEQSNAKYFLEKHIQKYGITDTELNSHVISDEYSKMSNKDFYNLMLYELMDFGINFLVNLFIGNKNPFPEFKNDGILIEFLNRTNRK